MSKWTLYPDRYFDPDPAQKSIAGTLYDQISGLPLICPHGHVDPRIFADPDYRFGSPAEVLIIPDHYVFRMLFSQGVSLESLGVSRSDGGEVESDHRKIWQTFADHFYLFRGTPTGMWLAHELTEVFGISEKLNGHNAQAIYDQLEGKLKSPEFSPRALYQRFNIEVLATTDAATDNLEHHQAIRESGWSGRILPTFRPDNIINIDTPGWKSHIDQLSDLSGIHVHNYKTLIDALENRRTYFRSMGATATDHGALYAVTDELAPAEIDDILHLAFHGSATAEDARRFTGHMLLQMAHMSSEDGLVMQMHIGSYRNHNSALLAHFGRDKGADIPIAGEFTRALQPLLNRFGMHPDFTLIVFTLDEATYGRELAPLAGHYPALKLGPPWWFYDSLNGMRRYFDTVMETAGLYNTAGFNDDTRAFPSIPARHDLWRRSVANWLAGLVVRGIVDLEDAQAMAQACAYDLAKQAYKL
ncbi:MAG: glucuronate isomerase [bacterium]|nr:glucuronate isomerase [bacterium]